MAAPKTTKRISGRLGSFSHAHPQGHPSGGGVSGVNSRAKENSVQAASGEFNPMSRPRGPGHLPSSNFPHLTQSKTQSHVGAHRHTVSHSNSSAQQNTSNGPTG